MRTPFELRCDEAWTADRDQDLRFSIAIFRHRSELICTPETRLYVIRDEVLDAVKIGVGGKPRARLSNLQIGNASPLELILDVPAYAGLEKLIHRLLREQRIQGEWFRCEPPTLVMCEALMCVDGHQRDVLRAGDSFDADFALGVLGSAADEFLLSLERDAA